MADTDLLVVGAGLAGLPIALACEQAGWDVIAIDQHEQPAPVPNHELDQRCTAIGAASVELLRSWGFWDSVSSDAEAIQSVHVSQKGYLGSVQLSAAELSVPALGYVFENRRWVHQLNQRLTQQSNIELVRGQTVVSIEDSTGDNEQPVNTQEVKAGAGENSIANESGRNAITVHLSSGRKISTRLLVAADGVNSRVRDLVGVGDTHIDYEQSALMTTVKLAQPHGGQAFERFTSAGPLAFLPRPGNIMSVVWCLDTDVANQYNNEKNSVLIEQLQTLFGFRLGRITDIGERVVVPLYRREALHQIGTRTVLMGNAVRLLHPVAGQGFNLALRDTACLLDALGLKTDEKSSDPGSEKTLNQFVRTRQRDQQQVVSLTDSLAKTFRGHTALPAHIRGLGLMGLDSVAPLKTRFARRTMGFTG